jgi:(p)ppGpp synthase/HD superfamily hydrolase
MKNVSCWRSEFMICQYSEKLLNKLNLLNSRAYCPVDINEITKAIYYARKYHGSQMRKSGEPYYSHPIEVAHLVANHTALKIPKYFRTDLLVTSILHDCIEDTELTKNMITDIFGIIIANQVDDLTRIKIDKKITAAETLNLLFPQNKKDLLHIKLFDRLHNMRTLYAMSPNNIAKIIDETLGYFVPLAIYLDIGDIANELLEICYQYLPPHINLLGQQESVLLQMGRTFSEGNSQTLSPTFRNEIIQRQKRHLQES